MKKKNKKNYIESGDSPANSKTRARERERERERGRNFKKGEKKYMANEVTSISEEGGD